MLQKERQNLILKEIDLHNKVLTTDLCAQLNVSLDTVRRDLAELQKNGKLIKVHGGALSKSFHHPLQQQTIYAKEKKKDIASKAVRLMQDGMTFLTGGGTVMLELARMVPENLRGTFFTVSPLVALEVAQRSTVDVILIGGQLSANSFICTGSSVISQLAEIRVDICFIGTNGLSINEGLTDYDWEVVQVKKAMVKSSKKIALLSITEKLESSYKYQICNLNAINYMLTELDPEDEKLSKYAKIFKVI